MKNPPMPPPPPPELPPNAEEIADQQLQKTAPSTLTEQNKENVQNLKDLHKNKNVRINEASVAPSKDVDNIEESRTTAKVTQVVTIAPISPNTTLNLQNAVVIATGISTTSPKASATVVEETPEEQSTENIQEEEESPENPEPQTENSQSQSKIPETQGTPQPQIESPQPENSVLPEKEAPPFNIADLPIVVEIPIIPKIEKDADIGDIVQIPKLIEIEKLTIKQEVVSPVRSTAPQFPETELVKENVMVQIPQENLTPPKETPSPEPPQKKKRGRKKKNLEEKIEPQPTKRKSDTQKPPNKKKKVEPITPPKKTRTKKGRSKSLQELSSPVSKHLRVKSPLELNEILKAKHSDFHVPKALARQVICGLKKGITTAMEK